MGHHTHTHTDTHTHTLTHTLSVKIGVASESTTHRTRLVHKTMAKLNFGNGTFLVVHDPRVVLARTLKAVENPLGVVIGWVVA